MAGPPFKYDVAFSFLKEDEQLARSIYDVVAGRLRSFIYSEAQLDLAGADGVEAFTKVFAEEARVVVVLYRARWGETPWTRVEAAAIKTRFMQHGYDFLLMIPLDTPRQVPTWYPFTLLWYDVERHGAQAAAVVIEDRVRKAGGAPHEPTAEEMVELLGVEKAAEEDRLRAYLFDGPKWAQEEAGRLYDRLEAVAGGSRGQLRVERDEKRGLLLLGDGYFLGVVWHVQFVTANTLDDSRLKIGLQEGTDTFKAHVHIQNPRLIQHRSFRFHVTKEKERRWLEDPDGERFTTDRLATESVRMLVEQIRIGRKH